MLFGTAKRLSKKNHIDLEIEGQQVNHTSSYYYLGNDLDQSLNLNDNFDKTYKRVNGRLNLLKKMRKCLNVEAAYKIFEMVILPLLLYSSLINLQLYSTSQKRRLCLIKKRDRQIIGGAKNVGSIEKPMKKSV